MDIQQIDSCIAKVQQNFGAAVEITPLPGSFSRAVVKYKGVQLAAPEVSELTSSLVQMLINVYSMGYSHGKWWKDD